MSLKGNRGEWSELYTLLKLMADGRIYGADKDLNKIDTVYYDIIKAIRRQTDDRWEYVRNGNVKVVSSSTGETILTIPIQKFKEQSEILLEKIKSLPKGKDKKEIPEINPFARKILPDEKIKESNKNKADIILKVHDVKTGSEPTLGFSIKSMLGSPSTLLNPGKTTNFIFEVTGNISDTKMNEFNSIKKRRGNKVNIDFINRASYIRDNQLGLVLHDMENKTFKNNLMLIDTSLANICGLMLKVFYINNIRNVADILKVIKEKNELNYDLSDDHPFYEYKFKKLITESALGMKPASIWDGKADATGGYIIVKEDGELLCYHLYNRNEFEDYLIKNTCFDKPSTSRYEYGSIYKEDDKYFIKLNLQIRFIK